METIIVTRHQGLVEYLRREGLAPEGCEVIDHATAQVVRGKRVIGVLPLHLAAEAAEVVEVPMNIPASLRGVELTAEQTKQYAGDPQSYRVERLARWSVQVLHTGNPVGERPIAILARLLDSEEEAHRLAKEWSRERWRGFLVAPCCDNLLPSVAYQDGRRLVGGWIPTMTLGGEA